MGGNDDNEWYYDNFRSLVDFLEYSILYTVLHLKRVILAGVLFQTSIKGHEVTQDRFAIS